MGSPQVTREPPVTARLFVRLLAAALALLAAASLVPLLQLDPRIVIALVLVAGLLAVPVAGLLRLVLKRLRERRYRRTWAWSSFGLATLLLTLAAAPIWGLSWFAENRPLTIPRATLTQGERTVVFQGMIHAASPAFYDHVRHGIDQALADGYVIYHEGVLPSDPDANAWLASVVPGSGDLGERQKTLAGICGLQYQRDAFPDVARDIQAEPARHVQADVSVADIKREFERLQGTPPPGADADPGSPIGLTAAQTEQLEEAFERFLVWHAAGADSRRDIVRQLCAGVMSLFIDEAALQRVPWPLSAVIIDFRDRALARRIADDPRPRIYVVYGAGHYAGLIRELIALDPRWQVSSREEIRLSGVDRRVSVAKAVDAGDTGN